MAEPATNSDERRKEVGAGLAIGTADGSQRKHQPRGLICSSVTTRSTLSALLRMR